MAGADEPLDVWLKPYEQTGDTEAAMNAYLSWEVDLLERIEQDGTTNFRLRHAPQDDGFTASTPPRISRRIRRARRH